MNCKEFQDIILTDYLDGEINAENQAIIEQHLSTCSQCLEFAKTARELAVVPFESIEKVNPPEDVWFNIKDQIQEEQVQPHISFHEIFSGIFSFKKPVFAFATMAVVILFIVFTYGRYTQQQPVKINVEQQIEYLAYLIEDGTDTEGEIYDDYDSAIEEFFL